MVSLFKYIWLDSFLIYNRLFYWELRSGVLCYKFLHTQTCIIEASTIFRIWCYFCRLQICRLILTTFHFERFLWRSPFVSDIYIRLSRYTRKIFDEVNYWGKRLSRFFFFIPSLLFFTLPYPPFCPQAFYLLWGWKEPHVDWFAEWWRFSFPWYKRGRVSISVRSRESTAGVGKSPAGVAVHVDATWYMRVAATSKLKGNATALLITDRLEACSITAYWLWLETGF